MYSIQFPSERSIEDYVYHEITESRVCPIGGDPVDLVIRQRRIDGYGIADILKIAFDENFIWVTVLELKNEPLKADHVVQLSRYMAGVKRILAKVGRRLGMSVAVYGELAGPFDPQEGDLVYLIDNLKGINIFSLSLTMEEGFINKQISSGWYISSAKITGNKDVMKAISRALKAQKEEDMKVSLDG